MKKQALIDGDNVSSEEDFHVKIARAMDFPAYYGKNLNALWDILSGDLPQPTNLVWSNAAKSRIRLGPTFNEIVKVLKEAQAQYASWETHRFTYELKDSEP
jgi:ribonuclease inhibitor